MIYVQVGLFAEGSSDYDLLIPLIDRLLADLMARRPETFADRPEPKGIDAPDVKGSRSERIAAAIERYWDVCTLFVIHADADGDPDAAQAERIAPGLAEARRRVGAEVPAAACVPVRELEAWMLADEGVFRALYPTTVSPLLPPDPEKDLNPKRTLDEVFRAIRRRRPPDIYPFWGANLDLAALRRLPAFQKFERDLSAALDLLASN